MANLDLPFTKISEAGMQGNQLVVNISVDIAAFSEALRRAMVSAGKAFHSALAPIAAFCRGPQGRALLRDLRRLSKRYQRYKRHTIGAGGSARDRRRRARARARIAGMEEIFQKQK